MLAVKLRTIFLNLVSLSYRYRVQCGRGFTIRSSVTANMNLIGERLNDKDRE